MFVEICEGLYKAVALCEHSWESWERFNNPMIESEVFRVFYLIMCLDFPHQRARGITIIKRHRKLYKEVKRRLDNVKENHYSIQAKKTKYKGIWYDSVTEARLARVLDEMGIACTPHVTFNGLYTPELKPFSYTVDFIFESPQKLKGIPDLVNGLEAKGAIEAHDFIRIDALSYFRGVKIWIVPLMLIEFWEREIKAKKNGKATD